MWGVLTSLVTNAKCIRVYDGFMDRTSMDVLKGMGIHDAAVVRMPSPVLNNWRTLIIQAVDSNLQTKNMLKVWVADIGAQVAAGKNVMVFYLFKYETDFWPSMMQTRHIICAVGDIDMTTDTDVMHYDGMLGATKKLILSGINTYWNIYVAMPNTVVTSGVNFSVPDRFVRLHLGVPKP
jgi:hypothetical protein